MQVGYWWFWWNSQTWPAVFGRPPGDSSHKSPEINEIGQGLSNACLTFKIGWELVKWQLGKVSHILEKIGTSPDFSIRFQAKSPNPVQTLESEQNSGIRKIDVQTVCNLLHPVGFDFWGRYSIYIVSTYFPMERKFIFWKFSFWIFFSTHFRSTSGVDRKWAEKKYSKSKLENNMISLHWKVYKDNIYRIPILKIEFYGVNNCAQST